MIQGSLHDAVRPWREHAGIPNVRLTPGEDDTQQAGRCGSIEEGTSGKVFGLLAFHASSSVTNIFSGEMATSVWHTSHAMQTVLPAAVMSVGTLVHRRQSTKHSHVLLGPETTDAYRVPKRHQNVSARIRSKKRDNEPHCPWFLVFFHSGKALCAKSQKLGDPRKPAFFYNLFWGY